MSFRLLCIGTELDSLQTRSAVLNHCGYDAKSATIPEAEILLRTEEFDLVILSAFLSQEERGRLILAARDTPTLVLEGRTVSAAGRTRMAAAQKARWARVRWARVRPS
jgi:hypothetical protein